MIHDAFIGSPQEGEPINRPQGLLQVPLYHGCKFVVKQLFQNCYKQQTFLINMPLFPLYPMSPSKAAAHSSSQQHTPPQPNRWQAAQWPGACIPPVSRREGTLCFLTCPGELNSPGQQGLGPPKRLYAAYAAARSRSQGAYAASAQQVAGRPVARRVLLEFRHSLPALLGCIGTAGVEPAA